MSELLGAAHDSANILRNAVTYLETPPWMGDWEIPEYERMEWAAAKPGRGSRRNSPVVLV